MKLLAKTRLYYLLLSIPSLLVASFLCYLLLENSVAGNNDDFFRKQKQQISYFIDRNDTTALRVLNEYAEFSLQPLQPGEVVISHYSDTLIFDKFENELVDVQMFISELKTKKGNYALKLWRSTLDTDELLTSVALFMSVSLVFLFLVLFIGNWWISKQVWKPFYATANALQSFRANNPNQPTLVETSVIEFMELNASASKMMTQMQKDFKSQKQFTENASHEMQTPLAVIKSKIELLFQSETLGKSETELIAIIDNAVTKLSRLNKSLLLLTNIENRQFVDQKTVSLNVLIDDSLKMFEDNILDKNIQIIKNLDFKVNILINVDLGSILVSNLLQNAIRHNDPQGTIKISSGSGKLMISNTSSSGPLDPAVIYNRFQKNSAAVDSLGLGLAIVKEIALFNNIDIEYNYVKAEHIFTLHFTKI